MFGEFRRISRGGWGCSEGRDFELVLGFWDIWLLGEIPSVQTNRIFPWCAKVRRVAGGPPNLETLTLNPKLETLLAKSY